MDQAGVRRPYLPDSQTPQSVTLRGDASQNLDLDLNLDLPDSSRLAAFLDREPRALGRRLNIMTNSRIVSLRTFVALTLVLALLASACGGEVAPSVDDAWGPLAVTDPDGGMDALMYGELIIDNGCVLLNEQGDEVLLVWPRRATGWDEATETVFFESSDGTVHELRDGDQLQLGGGGGSVDEGGLDQEALLAQTDWVSAPDASCLRDIVWEVSDARLGTP